LPVPSPSATTGLTLTFNFLHIAQAWAPSGCRWRQRRQLSRRRNSLHCNTRWGWKM